MNNSKQILQRFCKEIIYACFQQLFLFIDLSHRLHFTNYRSKYILQNGSYPVYFVFGDELIVIYPRYCSCALSNVYPRVGTRVKGRRVVGCLGHGLQR